MQQEKSYLRQALEQGLVGGAIIVLIALLGIVEAFKERSIVGTVLSMGQTFIIGTQFLISYRTARKAGSDQKMAITGGAVTGAVSGLVLAFLVLLSMLFDLRPVFLNASPALFSILAFGQSQIVGMVLLVVFGAGIGALAGVIDTLAVRIRSTILQIVAIVVLTGLLAELIKLVLGQWPSIGRAMNWMFAGKGLSIIGAVVVALVVLVYNVYQAYAPVDPKKKPFFDAENWRGSKGYVRIAISVAVLLILPQILGVYMSEVLDQVGLYILMGLGLNIVVGYAGLLDLGYVAFFAIGAYVVGVMTSPEIAPKFFGMTFTWWEAVIPAVLVATSFGVILGIPVLRMRGDYLAIVTLGFGEIIRIVALSDLLKPVIGGSQGIQGIAKPAIGGFVFQDQQSLYYIILAGVFLAAFVAIRLRDSRLGRSWMAMREDEDVAEAMGIHLVTTKLLAFATGAAFSGLSGAIFAAKIGSIYPHSFNLMVSINVLALIIVGGLGSIPGVVVGSFALVGLPELLREFADYRLLVYGALLVWMMLNRREGLWPEEAHQRELYIDKDTPADAEA